MAANHGYVVRLRSKETSKRIQNDVTANYSTPGTNGGGYK